MKKLYYFLNFTWGIIMNIIGAVGAGVMLAAGKQPIRHAGSIVFRTGHYWGGVSLGIFTFICEESGEHTLDHEFGHSIQNALYGPLFPFIVAIPSATRYWMIRLGKLVVEDYDDIWFEGQATEWGTKVAKEWK